MKLPPFLKRPRYGIYYLRYSVSSKFFRKFTDIQREYRVSLDTTKKREALRLGTRLYCEYDDLFSEALDMTKFEWEGKEVDLVEWMARNTQKLKAEKAAKKARTKENLQKYFDEALQGILTDQEKRSGLMNAAQSRRTCIGT